MSNKNLIIIAHVRDETIYFHDYLGRNTTVILLAEPDCYALKAVFLEFLNDLGVTVIDLRETETFNENYVMTKKSFEVIRKMITENKYEKIITHPNYKKSSDPQNKAIYDVVSLITKMKNLNNHYTYSISNKNNNMCETKRGIIELYSRIMNDNGSINKKMYDNYVNITSKVYGLQKIT